MSNLGGFTYPFSPFRSHTELTERSPLVDCMHQSVCVWYGPLAGTRNPGNASWQPDLNFTPPCSNMAELGADAGTARPADPTRDISRLCCDESAPVTMKTCALACRAWP